MISAFPQRECGSVPVGMLCYSASFNSSLTTCLGVTHLVEPIKLYWSRNLVHPHLGHCWETFLSCITKSLEGRNPCRSQFIAIKPCHHTDHIEGSSRAKVLEARFGQTNIA